MALNDSDTTVSQLQGIIKDFCDERGWEQFHNSKDLAIGMVTEASELLELFRFKSDEQISKMMSCTSVKVSVSPNRRTTCSTTVASPIWSPSMPTG